jgi:beta-lactamase superfamily II metal-dependent hydrolase
MSAPAAVPESRLGPEGGLEAACAPGDLLYFLLNVGDGDTQLLLLPEDRAGRRRAIVIDIAGASKLSSFLDHLATSALLPETDRLFSLVVATHPHEDHIGGMASFLDRFHSLVEEVWEPGYYHTTNSYAEMMRAIEDYDLRHTQPTSGVCRFIGNLQITVLAPGIGLRGRFDSYGIGINNASIALKLDFPASRVIQRRQDRTYVKLPSSKSLILGADAQTLSWSQTLVDFPQLGPQRTAASQALRAARGTVPLRADVFKVPHHGSKHGVNLELVEAISPKLSLISSVAGGGEYNFPHSVAQEAVREGVEALAGKASGKRTADHELGIHYTCERSDTGEALGTIGVLLTPGGRRRVWRFMDRASDRIDLARSRELI